MHLDRAYRLVLAYAQLSNQVPKQSINLHHAPETFILVQQVNKLGIFVRPHELQRVLVHIFDLIVRQSLSHLQ